MELERCPLEEQPEREYRQRIWHGRNTKRKSIGPLLDELHEVIGAAPDRLAEAELQAKQELERHQQQLRREKQLKVQQKLAEEARLAVVEAPKRRSLRSIRGIHYPRVSSATSSQPSPSLTPRPPDWSPEEQTLLFSKIQRSFPKLPNINHLRWELNKTVSETVAMTEQILGKIIAATRLDLSAKEQAAELRRIMSSAEVV
jgi:hypothetical protein